VINGVEEGGGKGPGWGIDGWGGDSSGEESGRMEKERCEKGGRGRK